MTASPRALSRAAAAGAAVGLVCLAGAASASAASYTSRTLNQPAATGLKVAAPLAAFRATTSARLIVPSAWQPTGGAAGVARFRAHQNSSCSYDLTYRVGTTVAATGDAAQRVSAELPAAGARYVLDSGTRGTRAFRVVRRQSTDGRIHLAALWTGVLTKRDDVVPSGQAAWGTVRVTAVSRPGSECHTGTYRGALGPAIGDSLAAARAELRFRRPD